MNDPRRVTLGGLLALFVGACAAGGPHPGRNAELAPPPDRIWSPEGAPRAVIVAAHGYGDYARSTFAEAARFWAEAGLETRAYDQRGFGADGQRGAWPGAEALIADFADAVSRARAARPDAPIVALGHSMGGGVALAAVGEARAEVDALVLLAPAIAGGDALNPLARAMAWSVAAIAPDRRWTGEGLVSIQASDDIEMLRRLAADPLYLGQPSAREILGLIRIMDRASLAARSLRTPTLALFGERDEVIDGRGARDALSRAPIEVGIRTYPEGWHMLLRDHQKRAVWLDVRDYALAATR